MAWTATLVSADPDPANPQNIKAHVQLTDGKETINIYPLGRDLDDTNLKRLAWTVIEQNLASRDLALPKIKALIGQAIPVEAPPQADAALLTFRTRWNRLMRLKALGSVDATIVSQVVILQGQVETYLKANPNAIDNL